MRSDTDPYARKRAYWPILQRMASRLYWTWVLLARTGLLNRSGPVARWLMSRFVELEHGLRCLLIIKASDKSRRHNALPQQAARNTPAPGFGSGSGVQRNGFSLTLTAFDEACRSSGSSTAGDQRKSRSSQSDCRLGATPELDAVQSEAVAPVLNDIGADISAGLCDSDDGAGRPPCRTSPADQFARRLDAIAAVFADPDAYAARMERRVQARGWGLFRRHLRPVTAPVGFRRLAPAIQPGFAPAAAIIDTS